MKHIIILLAAPVILFTGCGYAETKTDMIASSEITTENSLYTTEQDITAGLVYDESSNTWSTDNGKYKKFVNIMYKECFEEPEIRGTYLLATDDEIIFIGGINGTDINGNKVDACTTYEIGSITKTFTATAVFQLCERGVLSLDDTLDKYFPQYEYGKDITIDNLLRMQSGLRREFFGFDEQNIDMEVFKKYYNDGFTDEELLSELFSSEPECTPGTEIRYSNAGYTLLAMIIEQVTGRSYADYIQKNIFDVCGMEHSSSMTIGDVTSVPEPVPDGTYPFSFGEVFDSPYDICINNARGAGDIHSCCADLLIFDRALIGGKLINEDSLASMFDMGERTPGKVNYGCGWMSNPMDVNAYEHTGGTPSYMSGNFYMKSEKYGNIYLLQLHSSYTDGNYYAECVKSIITAAKY